MDRSLLENRVHGDALFPLSVYFVKATGDHFYNCHWHDELELVLVREGRAFFQIGATHFEAVAGEAVFVNSRELHAAYPAPNMPGALDALVFHPNLLYGAHTDILQERFIDPVLRQEYRLPIRINGAVPWQEEVLNHLAAVMTIGREKPFTYELLIKSHLYLIFSLLITNSEQGSGGKNGGEHHDQAARVKAALQYIQTHYRQKITLQELAAAQNVSAAHFCRLFKQVARKTPVDYINDYRIQKAALLLADEQRKITDIAMEVGFDNISYFIQTFKHYMKVTPSQYRREHGANKTEHII